MTAIANVLSSFSTLTGYTMAPNVYGYPKHKRNLFCLRMDNRYRYRVLS